MALRGALSVIGGGRHCVNARRQSDGLAVGHLYAPARRQGECTARRAFVALCGHFSAVERTGKTVLIDASDGVIDGETLCPSLDGLDFLIHLDRFASLVVETAVEGVVSEVVSCDVGLCRSSQRKPTEHDYK